jgi:hypothetical protein
MKRSAFPANGLTRMTEILLQKNDHMTPQVFQCLETCPDGAVLKFLKGEYHFYPDEAFGKVYYISNNRHGPKRIAFPILGKKNLTIDGGGSRFIFHGEIIPFIIEQSEHITLKNFSIDWQRPFYSQGIITAADEAGVEVEVNRDAYPYHFEKDGTLLFDGEGWSHGFTEGIFEMDPRTGGPALLSGDNLWGLNPRELNPQQAGDRRIRFNNRFPHIPTIGNILLLRHYPRLCPGIHLKQSRDTLIEQVELNHCGGMGIIAQFSENITIDRGTVRPTPGSGRLFSVTVDATHFVNCRGLVRIKDSFFSSQMDDPANVHGTNTRIKEVLDDFSVITERVHHEQRGVEIAFPGDRLNIAHNDDLLRYASLTVQTVREVDPQFCKLSFEEPLPESLRPGDVLDNRSWAADVHISGCTSLNNRARGYLLSTPGEIRLENNRISASGAGVKISGDANYWFESGAVRDVLIRNNEFGDCCYGPPQWGRAVIDIDPEISNPWKNTECYHRNIRIENNLFRTFDTGLLYARSVEGLRFAGNRAEPSATYPPAGRMAAAITLDACRNSDIQDLELSIEINETFHTRHHIEKQPSLACA